MPAVIRRTSVRAITLALVCGMLSAADASANQVIVKVPIFATDYSKLSCGFWLKARAHGGREADLIEAWAFGYGSAYVGAPGVVSTDLELSPGELLIRIDSKCRADPRQDLSGAIRAAVESAAAKANVR